MIVNGDCLEELQRLEDGSVDMIITDPPYTTPTVTAFGRTKVKNFADFSIQEAYIKMLKSEFERVLKPNGAMFMFCDEKYYPSIFKVFYPWKTVQMIVWDKEKIGMGKPFRKRHELIVYANRESIDYNRTEGITHFPTVMKCKPIGQDRVHGAQKPVKLISDLIEGFSNEGETILDCFMGSGTTGIACKNLNRTFVGIELDETYFNIAKERIENHI